MTSIPGLIFSSFLLVSTQATYTVAEEAPDWAGVSAIFVRRCVMCHSEQAAARGLRLDTYEAAVAGSAKGAVLVPGNTVESELIRRLRGESMPRMPFLSSPLPPEQIDLIVRWVEAGLPETDNHSLAHSELKCGRRSSLSCMSAEPDADTAQQRSNSAN
jgi:hypothetical protein